MAIQWICFVVFLVLFLRLGHIYDSLYLLWFLLWSNVS